MNTQLLSNVYQSFADAYCDLLSAIGHLYDQVLRVDRNVFLFVDVEEDKQQLIELVQTDKGWNVVPV